MQKQQIKNDSTQITIKGVITAVLIIAMLIPTMMIMGLVKERKHTQQSVIQEVSNNWSQEQTYAAPYLIIPTTKSVFDGKRTTLTDGYKIVLPDNLSIDGNISPELKKRNIYEVVIYKALMQTEGYFNLAQVNAANNETIHWHKAMICFGLNDMRGVEDDAAINIVGQKLIMENAVPSYALLGTGASADINLSGYESQSKIPFNFPLKLKGSLEMNFLPLGKSTKVKISSTWNNPSFRGNYLPENNVTKNGFTASWKLNSVNRNLPQVWNNVSHPVSDYEFGVSLLQGSDHYTRVERSVKYAILFIGLTFGFFFIMELVINQRVHPVQYVLTGIALIIFYTLLLSFGEYLGFNIAYFIASIATISLITLYCKQLFRQWKHAFIFGLFLSALYGFIFVIIQMEELNLLVGSIGLFVLVALAMWLSRKVDWYKSGN